MLSAFEDDRFDPIAKDEIPKLSVTVSILENFEVIEDLYDWTVGTHGVEIEFEFEDDEFSATFLPEVAKEEGWDHK